MSPQKLERRASAKDYVGDRCPHRSVYTSKIRLDNGSVFVTLPLAEWSEREGIRLDFIELGRRMQNSFIGRFKGRLRRGALGMHVFRHLTEVQEKAELWLHEVDGTGIGMTVLNTWQ